MSNFKNESDLKAYVVYKENGYKIFNEVDKHFENYACDLGAERYSIPSMIDKDVLEKCGYMTSFPHHLTAAAYVTDNNYNEVSANNECNSLKMNISNMFFTPAACLHVYPCLSGEKIDKKIITSLVNVFRSEDKQYDAMTRLWNFRVREVVFIGDDKFVLDNLDDIMNEAKRYAESLGIKAEIEEASDNFYPTKRNNIKAKLQISNSLKKELITYIGEKKVALASFNFHGNHFSEPFDFSDGGRVVSGCAGFGLERWVSAIQSVRSENE